MSEVFFWGKRKCHWRREIRRASNKQNWRKHCKSSSNCAWNRRLTVRSIAQQVTIDRERVRKILTDDLDMRKVCAKIVPKELTEERKQRRVTICQDLLERQDDILAMSSQVMKHGSTNTTLKQVAKCTMEDCQFPKTKNVPSVQLKSQNNVADFFWY